MCRNRRPKCLAMVGVISTVAVSVMSCWGGGQSAPESSETRSSQAMETSVVELGLHDAVVKEWATELIFSTTSFEDVLLGESGTVFARLNPDGAMVVSAGAEILQLGPQLGRQVKIAREGNGPGEFRGVSGLGVAYDGSLFATDYSNGRFTHFELGGEVKRVIPRIRPYAEGAEAVVLTLLPDGKMLGIPVQWRPARGRGSYDGIQGDPFLRDPVPLLVFDSAGEIVDSLGRWSGLERANGMVVPFARSVMYHSRGAWTVVGESDSLDLSLFHGTSLKLQVIGPGRGVEPSTQLRREWDSAVVLALPELGIGQALTNRMADVAGPPSVPAFAGVVVDDEQNIWVGEYLPIPHGNRRWWVLSREGQLLATVVLPAFDEILLPARTELLDVAGGMLVLMRQGDDGEIQLEVRSILRD